MSASQPAEFHARTQRDDSPRPADRIAALAGSGELSGFAPFLSPVMFFVNENSWPATTLIVSLAAILLAILIVIVRCRHP